MNFASILRTNTAFQDVAPFHKYPVLGVNLSSIVYGRASLCRTVASKVFWDIATLSPLEFRTVTIEVVLP